MSIVNLSEFKELKQLRRCEESYNLYLKSLGNTQLELEVYSLLDEFSQDNYDQDFFTKGKMILKEITLRAQGPVKLKIENMSKEVLLLI